MTRAKNPDAREGNARGSAEVAPLLSTPSAAVPTPPPPPHLDELGAEVWRDVFECGEGAYLPTIDGWAIERYADLQSRRMRLRRQLDEHGFVTVGSQGQEVLHPSARLLADTERQLLPLEDRLGLNPDARLRLGLAKAATQSALDRFIQDTDDDD